MSDTAIEEVTDAELHQAFIAARETEMMTAFPAKVEAYHADTQTADVVPALAKHLPDGQGNYVPELPPKISDVPVCFPRCGSFFLSFPIKAGDFVLVVCCQKNIGNWRATGNAGDPGDLGMHTLDGAVAIPGVFPDSGKLSDASGTTMKMGKDGTAAAQIEITDSLVKLGGGANFVALANKVKAWFDAFNTAVNGWTPAPNDGGAALKAALASLIGGTPSTDVAASNVKAT
jgi:hypothetical protein